MRRSLITPEVRPKGRGHLALYGWRSLLAVRLLALIHSRFGGSIAHWGPIVEVFRQSIQHVSFPALHGQHALCDGTTMVVGHRHPSSSSALIVALDEHLLAISRGLGTQELEPQLPLFPPMLVSK
jgi:hypothetical protein